MKTGSELGSFSLWEGEVQLTWLGEGRDPAGERRAAGAEAGGGRTPMAGLGTCGGSKPGTAAACLLHSPDLRRLRGPSCCGKGRSPRAA